MNENDFAALSAGYALNALNDADRRAFEEALTQHPEWSSHVRADLNTVASFSAGVAAVTPPPAIRTELLARISDTPQLGDTTVQDALGDADGHALDDDEDYAAAGPAPVVPAVEQARTNAAPPRRWFVLAASIALVAVLGFGTVTAVQQFTRPAAVIALESIENAPDARSVSVAVESGGEATAYWSEELRQAVFVSDGLATLADDKSFELWFVRDGEAIPAGTFDDSDTTAVLAGAFQPGDTIAVTIEQAGGSPDGVPTTAPIVAIPTV